MVEDCAFHFLNEISHFFGNNRVQNVKTIYAFCQVLLFCSVYSVPLFLITFSLKNSSVTAVRLPDGLSFVVYEFWDGEEEWKR